MWTPTPQWLADPEIADLLGLLDRLGRSPAREDGLPVDDEMRLVDVVGRRPVDARRAFNQATVRLSAQYLRDETAPGLSDDEFHEQLRRRVADVFADKTVTIRATEQGLAAILDSGRVKTQFETQTSGGALNNSYRAEVEEQHFGYPQDLPAEQRPVYGYLAVDGTRPAGSSGSLSGTPVDILSVYGKVQLRLKPEVRARTTAMVGDSLNDRERGRHSPVDDPDWESFTPVDSTDGFADVLAGTLDRDYTGQQFRESRYVEAVVHGGVRVEDVAEVLLPRTPPPDLAAAIGRSGVPWRVYGYEQFADAPADRRVAEDVLDAERDTAEALLLELRADKRELEAAPDSPRRTRALYELGTLLTQAEERLETVEAAAARLEEQ